MKGKENAVVLGIAVACWFALISPENAQAQTTAQSVRGTWVANVGSAQALQQFNADGTYYTYYTDIYGGKMEDRGRYSVVAGTVLATSNSGGEMRLYFFWEGANRATIRVTVPGSSHFTDTTFVRVR